MIVATFYGGHWLGPVAGIQGRYILRVTDLGGVGDLMIMSQSAEREEHRIAALAGTAPWLEWN